MHRINQHNLNTQVSKFKPTLLVLAFLLALTAGNFLMPVLAQADTELWHKTYDSGRDDVANGVAIDSGDNIIVAGYMTNASGNTDFYTIKYDRNGNQVWSETYDSGRDDAAYDVAVDSNDNIIVTGYTYASGKSDYYTIKYDRNGNQIWSKTYDDGVKTDWAWGVAVDSGDNVIVTGQRRDMLGDYYTIKYTKDGSEIWSQEYNPTPGEVFDVTVDSKDNVIVTGQCGFPNGRYHTVKYDKDGNQLNLLWPAIYGIPGDNEGKAVTVDSKDNVIVTGISGPPIYPGYLFGYCTIKYDENGNQIWVKTYSRGINDWAWGVAIDSRDNVVVTGCTAITSENTDYYTVRYDSNGNQIWSKTYDGGPDDEASDVAIDSHDNIVVTGYIKNASGNKDYCTIKYGMVVGGEIASVSKVGILAPWVIAIALIMVAGAWVGIWNRRHGTGRCSSSYAALRSEQ